MIPLPGGKAFDDVVGFKRVLVQRKGQFRKALTEKLMAYAVGRTMEAADRPALVEACGPSGTAVRIGLG